MPTELVKQNSDAATRGPPLNIILVEDDDGVRASTKDILEELGHKVAAFADAEAALRALTESTFDLIITDFQMPKMNGRQFGALATKANPGLPVLIVSAYAADAVGQDDFPMLAKPFSLDQLANAIRRTMTAAHSESR